MRELYDHGPYPEFYELVEAAPFVFGTERADVVPGTEASPETTQSLANTIQALVGEYGVVIRNIEDQFGRGPLTAPLTQRSYTLPDKTELFLTRHPEGKVFQNGHIRTDQAPFSVSPTALGPAKRPVGMFISGKYQFRESIFIDNLRTAYVHREVYVTKHKNRFIAEGVKPATEDEVEAAISLVVDIAQHNQPPRFYRAIRTTNQDGS